MAAITYRALLIGNSSFRDAANLPPLHGPATDVRVLAAALTDPVRGLHRSDDVTVLVDATKQQIEEAAWRFFEQARRDDQLLVYYSGHGRLDQFDRLYLCASDTACSRLLPTAVSNDYINGAIGHSPSRRIVILLDCCYSGAFKGVDLPRHLAGEGRFVISSVRGRELAADASAPGQPSAFTGALADTLLSGESDGDGDGFISIDEVYRGLERRLQERNLSPQRSFDRTTAEVALCRRPAAAARPPEPPAPPPELEISERTVEHRGVRADERLPRAVIGVRNRGGGRLDWVAECADDWIAVERLDDGRFALELRPRPGINRGTVVVRDRGAGGVRRLDVLVEVAAAPVAPPQPRSPPTPARSPATQGKEHAWIAPVAIVGGALLMLGIIVVAVVAEMADGLDDGEMIVPQPAGMANLQPVVSPASPIVPAVTAGAWQIEMNAFNLVQSRFDLVLAGDGTLQGRQTLHDIVAPLTGTWFFDAVSQTFGATMTATLNGVSGTDSIQVRLGGRSGDVLVGSDQLGRQFSLRRVP